MEENKDYQSSMEYSYGGGNATVQAPVKENVFLGAVGALAGTLIGVICIVITGQLGYVSALCGVVMGVCALRGYQMLGNVLRDPGGVEEGGVLRGMELLPMETELGDKKIRTQVRGVFHALEGELSELSGMELCGYEIHMGRSRAVPPEAERQSLCVLDVTAGEDGAGKEDGCFLGHVYGTYVHGIFDADGIAETVVRALAKKKGGVLKEENGTDYRAFKEAQYDSLAEALREALDMQAVRRIIGI